MLSKLKADLSAILERDPAAGGWISAIVLYPSFHVMLAHRLAHGAGLTALHYAARRGDVEIVTLLLEAGADPYIENEMGLNSFGISEKFGPFPSVRRALQEHVVRVIKKKSWHSLVI